MRLFYLLMTLCFAVSAYVLFQLQAPLFVATSSLTGLWCAYRFFCCWHPRVLEELREQWEQAMK